MKLSQMFATAGIVVGLMSGMISAGQGHGKHCGAFGPCNLDFMYHKIPDLTDQQKEELQKIGKTMKQEMQPICEKMGVLRKELAKLVVNGESQAVIDAKIAEIADQYKAMLMASTAHRMEIGKILTPQQKEYLRNAVEKWGFKPCFKGKGCGKDAGQCHRKDAGVCSDKK